MNPFVTRAKGNSPLPRNAPKRVAQGGLHETVGAGGTRRPWYAAGDPWPFWGRLSRKRSIGVGAPQNTLTGASAKLGFSLTVNFGANASGLQGGNFPATVGSVLNMSAAQIASSPAFSRYLNDQS